MSINKKELFGVEGFRIQRLNPDGSIPAYDNMLGTGNLVNVDALAGTETLILKEDNKVAVTNTVDITGGTYVDDEAATITEIVTELNLRMVALSMNLVFSKDATTGRLKAAIDTGTPGKVQLYGTLASYLGFGEKAGDAGKLTGLGLKIVKGFGATKSIGLPKNKKDKEEIENETADGNITSVIVNAITKGLMPVITVSKNDYELKQLILGGVYTPATETYVPATIEEQTTSPIFYVEIFSPVYNSGSNLRSNWAGVEKILLRKCSGNEGDLTKDSKTWTDLVYELDAVESLIGTVQYPAWEEQVLTVAQYEALDVENV